MDFKEIFFKDRLTIGITLGLVFMFFILFVLQKNVTGLSQEIESLRQIQATVAELDARHADMDKRVAALQALPEQTKAMVLENQINAMAHSALDMEQQANGKYVEEFRIVQGLLEKISTKMRN